jgi:hypothetical protein
MDINISPKSIQKATVAFLHRFHVMIFASIVLIGLIFVVYQLYNIVIQSADTSNNTPVSETTSFDQSTIKRINELKSRDQSADELDFSQGRSNPFIE